MTSTGFISTGQALFDEFNPGFSLLLIQILIILLACRLIAIPFAYIRQPKVIAEVIAGILLGPTLLGRWAWFRNTFFPPESLGPLTLLANIGLIFFLLLMGLELDLSSVRERARVSLTISLAGIFVPFAFGVAVAWFLYLNLPGNDEMQFAYFALFIGVCMSVTALPVLARILTERKLLQTPVGVAVISAAVVDDAVAWIFLALVVSLISATSPISALYIFLIAVAFTLFMFTLVSPALLWAYRKFTDIDRLSNDPHHISQPMVILSFLITMISAFFTEALGIHSIFGGFITGLSLPRENGFALALTHRLEDMVTILLLPLYFTLSGLKTDIGNISDGLSWGSFFLVFFSVGLGKVGGCSIAARLTGSSWREAFAIGAMMNTKGLVEIIILNIGLKSGVITEQLFSIMVLMAVTTTLMTTPLISVLYPPSMYQTSQEPKEEAEVEEISLKYLKDPLSRKISILLAIPNIKSLPTIMNLVQHLNGNDESSGNTTIHAARLMQINERFSTLLIAAHESETIQRDPALNIFTSFGNSKKIAVVPHIVLSSIQNFSKDIAYLAYETQSDLVVIPWHNKFKGAQETPSSALIPSWFSTDGPSETTFEEDTVDGRITDITDQLIRKCRVKVGVLVNRGMESDISEITHILVPFFGGPDDRESLLLALRLGSNNNVHIHISHIWALQEKRESHPVEKYEELKSDEEDIKIITFIKKVVSGEESLPCTLTYSFLQTETPLKAVLDQMSKETYSMIILGHFGPDWNLQMNPEKEETKIMEENSGTVWSVLGKQNTINTSSIKRSKASVLGKLGSLIYSSGEGKETLLVIRKVRNILEN